MKKLLFFAVRVFRRLLGSTEFEWHRVERIDLRYLNFFSAVIFMSVCVMRWGRNFIYGDDAHPYCHCCRWQNSFLQIIAFLK